jgi:hypothetical protein
MLPTSIVHRTQIDSHMQNQLAGDSLILITAKLRLHYIEEWFLAFAEQLGEEAVTKIKERTGGCPQSTLPLFMQTFPLFMQTLPMFRQTFLSCYISIKRQRQATARSNRVRALGSLWVHSLSWYEVLSLGLLLLLLSLLLSLLLLLLSSLLLLSLFLLLLLLLLLLHFIVLGGHTGHTTDAVRLLL